MARVTRTFIAVPLGESVTKRLARLQSQLSEAAFGVRWVEPQQMHLTLAFLGDVTETDLNAVCHRAVEDAVADFKSFSVRVEGLGAFPDPERPRVLWAGLIGELEPVLELRKAVVDAVAWAGYPPEDDRFSPHITLGRIKQARESPLDLTAVIKRNKNWSAGSLDIESVVTFGSILAKEGPEYLSLGTARLRHTTTHRTR